MTKSLDDIGLKSVADQYDLFFVDLWGVVHNGIELETNPRLIKILKPELKNIEFNITKEGFVISS